MEANGPVVDLVEHFAAPIPFLVICELLGLPDEDRAKFQQLGNARFDVSQGGIGTMGAVSESREFLLEAVRRQRTNPGDGLIGKIITDHGDEIDDIDLGGLADGVFTGGFETSASMLALGSLVLLQNPEHLAGTAQRRRGDRADRRGAAALPVGRADLLPAVRPRRSRAVRRAGQGRRRDRAARSARPTATRPAGTTRPVSTRRWRRFDPRRPTGPHYAFGHGFHRCIGAELAKMELRAAYPALVRRFPDLALAADPADLNFRKLSIVYGVESLPVRLHSAAVGSSRQRLNEQCQSVAADTLGSDHDFVLVGPLNRALHVGVELAQHLLELGLRHGLVGQCVDGALRVRGSAGGLPWPVRAHLGGMLGRSARVAAQPGARLRRSRRPWRRGSRR